MQNEERGIYWVHRMAMQGDPAAGLGRGRGRAWQTFGCLQPAGANMRLSQPGTDYPYPKPRGIRSAPQISVLKVRRDPEHMGLALETYSKFPVFPPMRMLNSLSSLALWNGPQHRRAILKDQVVFSLTSDSFLR